jgi:trehalose utilization protein
VKVLSWSEGSEDGELYPLGIRGAVADALSNIGEVRTAKYPETPDLSEFDVMFWWGHAWHDRVPDEHVADVVRHVTERGMGFVALHSAHFSRPFKALLNCSGRLAGWREARETEKLWLVAPHHPLAQGLPNPLVLDEEEMYQEPFDVPTPDDLVGISWFAGGEVFRSIAAWQRGAGRVVYFRPGHEEYPTFHQAGVRQFVRNAATWCAGV